MSTVLELEPSPFDRSRFLSDTAEDALYKSFSQSFREDISQFLLSPNFNSNGILPLLHSVVDRDKEGVIYETIDAEKMRDHDRFKPLHCHLGSLAIDPGVDPVVMDESFTQDLHEQLDERAPGFSLLGDWVESFARTDLLLMVQDINTLYEKDPQNSEWLVKAHKIIEGALDNPERYTISSEDLDSLYLITFLPHAVRQLTRRAIVGNVIIDQVRKEMEGKDWGTEDHEAFEALRTFYRSDALFGQHWDDRMQGFEPEECEDVSLHMSYLSAEQLSALGKLQKLVTSGNVDQIVLAWETVRRELTERIEAIDFDGDLSFWQLQDIGHCFESFNDWDLFNALHPDGDNRKVFEYTEQDKTGQKALILEDDSEQQESYVRLVNSHTPYETDGSLCFSTPEEIPEEVLDNSDLSLYIIDIQNEEDPLAGIKLAKKIFDRTLERVQGEEGEGLPQVEIVVWSTSHQATAAATSFFNKEIEEHPNKDLINYSFHGKGGRHWGGAPLSVTTQLKRFTSL